MNQLQQQLVQVHRSQLQHILVHRCLVRTLTHLVVVVQQLGKVMQFLILDLILQLITLVHKQQVPQCGDEELELVTKQRLKHYGEDAQELATKQQL